MYIKTSNPCLSFNPNYFRSILRSTIMAALVLFAACKKDFKSINDTNGAGSLKSASLTGSARPNIILILADDVGYEVPSIDGGQSYSTPNIDQMARNGMQFAQAHALPSCSPSRVSLLTGKHNNRNYTQWGHMETDQLTFANMLKDAGYATCYTGKWQLDGGDQSIHTFGFDQYSVWLPYDVAEYTEGSRYKNSKVFEGGSYLPPSESQGVYTDDKFTGYLLNFIDSVSSQNLPFFAMYSVMLCHPPMCPTPLDPEYDTWDYVPRNADKSFFPSMVKYMDIKIGQILDHINSLGIQDNTLILFTADNGTAKSIKSIFNGFVVSGGKKGTDEPGTNVPLISVWPGKIQPGSVSNRLVDFTDFLPTFADVAGIPKPTNYGALDGTSFYEDLMGGNTSNQKTYIYSAWNPDPINPKKKWAKWVQNENYKLFDTGRFESAGLFVKIKKGLPDSPALPDSVLTSEEKQLKRKFSDILNTNR